MFTDALNVENTRTYAMLNAGVYLKKPLSRPPGPRFRDMKYYAEPKTKDAKHRTSGNAYE